MGETSKTPQNKTWELVYSGTWPKQFVTRLRERNAKETAPYEDVFTSCELRFIRVICSSRKNSRRALTRCASASFWLVERQSRAVINRSWLVDYPACAWILIFNYFVEYYRLRFSWFRYNVWRSEFHEKDDHKLSYIGGLKVHYYDRNGAQKINFFHLSSEHVF